MQMQWLLNVIANFVLNANAHKEPKCEFQVYPKYALLKPSQVKALGKILRGKKYIHLSKEIKEPKYLC